MRAPLLLSLLVLALGGCEAAQRMATDAVTAATAAQTRSDADWNTNASEYRGQIGQQIAYVCPPGGQPMSVWGSGPYTDDSAVCGAAVHAGAITPSRGGRIVIEMRDGQQSYQGGRRNGIEAMNYGAWGGSFVVLR